MVSDKKPSRLLIGKTIITKEGKRMGIVKDISFETRSGELIHLILTHPTQHTLGLGLEKDTKECFLIPYNSVIAVGDFVVVSEEDLV